MPQAQNTNNCHYSVKKYRVFSQFVIYALGLILFSYASSRKNKVNPGLSSVVDSEKKPAISLRERLKDWSAILQSIFTIFAIIVGGIWTYVLFIKNRDYTPHSDISHRVEYRALDNNVALLHLSVIIKNNGKILQSLNCGAVYIYQILPLSEPPEKTVNQINNSLKEQTQKSYAMEWRGLKIAYLNWDSRPREIEPGEVDQTPLEFIIPSNIRTVMIYSFFNNLNKSSAKCVTNSGENTPGPIGWTLTTLHDLR